MIAVRLIDGIGTRIERLGKREVIATGAALIVVVAVCDFATGTEVSFSLFYLAPVMLTTWGAGLSIGLVTVLTCTLVWLLVDLTGGHLYTHELIPLWNALVRGGFFTIVCLMLWRLRLAVGRERELARTDALTGAWNKRFFCELLELENQRIRRDRRPFTLVYIDLDNFKQVNDRQGHGAGDAVLRAVVADLRTHLRRSDLVARIGGDEFALLLPETGPAAAEAMLVKLHAALTDEMVGRDSPVRFSLGALVCTEAAPDAETLLGAADALMYRAKRGGKNRTVHGTWPETPTRPTASGAVGQASQPA